MEDFITEKWPDLPSPYLKIIEQPNPVDIKRIAAFKIWLRWLRGDIEKVYRNGISIPQHFPTVPLIPKYALDNVQIPTEIKLQHEIQKYNFYEVGIYFNSKLDNNISLKNVKLKLKIKDNSKDRKTVVTSMVPDNTYKNLLKSTTTAKIAFTANASAKAEIPKVKLPIGYDGGANIVTEIDSKTMLTLPAIEINKTLVSAVGLYDTECSWEFEEVQKDEDIQVVVILKVPQEATEVKVKALLEVTPYHEEWWPLPDTRLKGMKTSKETEINLRT